MGNNLNIPKEYQLNSCLKNYTLDQDKTCPPLETFKTNFRKLIKVYPQTNFILKSIIETSTYSVFDFGDELITSHGKGATKHQARASALMEYIERRSWVDFDYKKAPGYQNISYEKLTKKQDLSAIDPLFKFAPQEIKIQEKLKKINFEWVNAFSLKDHTMIPYPLSYYNFLQTSNGLASGNTKEEAILQGICEVIERHCTSIFTQTAQINSTKIINPDSIKNTYIQSLIQNSKKQGITIILYDISYELPLCCIVARILDKNTKIEIQKELFGYGAHPNPEMAILRAITETFQIKHNLKNFPKNFDLKEGNWQSKLNINIPNNLPEVSLNELPSLSSNNFLEEINTIVKSLALKGYNTLICNKTSSLLDIPVYRIIIPGLQGIEGIMTTQGNSQNLLFACVLQTKNKKEISQFFNENKTEFGLTNLEIAKKIILSSLGNNINIEITEETINTFINSLMQLHQPDDYISYIKKTYYIHHDPKKIILETDLKKQIEKLINHYESNSR